MSEISRRSACMGMAAAIGLARSGMAQNQITREILIPLREPSPSGARSTLYGQMAVPGPLGLPLRVPTRLTLPNGLRILCWLPNPSPIVRLVVFSHGELGSPEAYHPLMQHWASHGFAVMAPIHDDSIIENSVRTAANIRSKTLISVLSDGNAWSARMDALRTCMDAVPFIEAEFGIRIDISHPVVAGHSFGAFAAAMMAGAKAMFDTGAVLDKHDRRFGSAMLISPQGRGILGLSEQSWADMSVPLLCMTGNGDVDVTGQTPQEKSEPYFLSPPGNKHLAWLTQVQPSWFSGSQTRPGDISERVFEDIKATTAGFLHAYGDYDANVLGGISSPTFTMETGGRLNLQYR